MVFLMLDLFVSFGLVWLLFFLLALPVVMFIGWLWWVFTD